MVSSELGDRQLSRVTIKSQRSLVLADASMCIYAFLPIRHNNTKSNLKARAMTEIVRRRRLAFALCIKLEFAELKTLTGKSWS